jgi:hypothetical protein
MDDNMQSTHHSEIEQLIEEAHLAIVRGEYDNAKAMLIRIHELQPDNPDSQRMLAEIPTGPTSRQLDDARIEQEKNEYYKRRQQYNDAQMWQGDGSYRRHSFIFDALWDFLGGRY